MNNELALSRDNGAVSLADRGVTSQMLLRFDQMWQVAAAIAKAGFINGVRTPEAALNLMLVCEAQGRHIGEAITRFHVIKNQPSVKADVMLADFQGRGGRVHWVRTDGEECIADWSHPRLHPEPLRIALSLRDLMESGVAMNWEEDPKTKQPRQVLKNTYRQFPASMLRARNISQGVKAIDPGAIHGLYTPEELGDIEEPERPADCAVTIDQPARSEPPSREIRLPGSPLGPDPRPYHQVVAVAVQEVLHSTGRLIVDELGGEVPEDFRPLEAANAHRHLLNAAVQAGHYDGELPRRLSEAVQKLTTVYRDHRDWLRGALQEFLESYAARLDVLVQEARERRQAEEDQGVEEQSQEAPEVEYTGVREPGEDG